MLGALRSWRSKSRFLAPTHNLSSDVFISPVLHYDEFLEGAETCTTELPPYQGLATVWHEYARHFAADYASFLCDLASLRGLQLRSVLDLACGTGIQTVKLADIVTEIVGLDTSEPMLRQARANCAALTGIQFVQADFRSFDLRRSFDAVVCADNSLNYVSTVDELAAIFRCVNQHLCPNGLFLCDTNTKVSMQSMLGYLHVGVKSQRFVLHFGYDPDRKEERSKALLRTGVETHVRIPLDPADVAFAAQESGLEVCDYFSSADISGQQFVGPVCYFVLARPE